MTVLMLGCVYPDTLPPHQFMLIGQNLGPKSLCPLMLHPPSPVIPLRHVTPQPSYRTDTFHVLLAFHYYLDPNNTLSSRVIGMKRPVTLLFMSENAFLLLVDFSSSYLVATNIVSKQE